MHRGAKNRAREPSTSGNPPAKRKRSRKLELIGEDWGAAVLEEQDMQEQRNDAPPPGWS